MNAIIPMRLPTEAMDWGRWIEGRLGDLETSAAASAQNEQNAWKSLNSSLSLLNSQVRALPATGLGQNTATGFGLVAGWATYATVNLVVPAGKTVATISAMGGVAVLDRTTGGVTAANAQILINSATSVSFGSAKDAGASMVNNIITPSFGQSLAVNPGDTISVQLQINPLNAAAFTASVGNYASLTVIALFSS